MRYVSLRDLLRISLVVALSLLLPWRIAGQDTQQKPNGRAALHGAVRDTTDAVVPGASVVLTNGAGLKRESQTDANGAYSFAGLDAGNYSLTISAPNFGVKVLDNIPLADGIDSPLDVTLEPAGAKTEISVESGETGKVETESATVSGTITQKEVVSIGLNGRNFTQLIALAPGVSNQTGQDEAKVGVVGSVKYSVNGGRVEYNTFEVDGGDVLNTGLNGASSTLMVYPSLDAIQEVKVLTSNYGAQFGRTASGTVQVTTKSGTEKLHGNLYDFTRNEAFNARNYFDPPGRVPLYRRQDFGGTFGGPLTIPKIFNTKRDKTFFFFSEEVPHGKNSNGLQPGSPLAKRAWFSDDAAGDRREHGSSECQRAGLAGFRFQRCLSLEWNGRILRLQSPAISRLSLYQRQSDASAANLQSARSADRGIPSQPRCR